MRRTIFALIAGGLAAGAGFAEDETSEVAKAVEENVEALFLDDMRIAVRLNDAFRVRQSGVELTVNLTNPDEDVDLEETFAMDVVAPGDSAALADAAKPGFAFHTYKVGDADAARMDAIRETVARLRAAAPGKSELRFSAVTPGCRDPGQAAPDALEMTLFLKIRSVDDYAQFTTPQPMTMTDDDFAAAFWRECDEGDTP